MASESVIIGRMRGTIDDDIRHLMTAIRTAGKCRRRVDVEYDASDRSVRFSVRVPMPRALANAVGAASAPSEHGRDGE